MVHSRRLVFPVLLLELWLAGAARPQSAESCKLCHDTIHAEWKESMHAKAWTDPIYQAALEKREASGQSNETCKPCHIPQPILLTGLGRMPTVREESLEEGVTCLSCHKGESRAGFHGPFEPKTDTEALRHVHASTHDPRYKTHELCATCHGIPEVKAHDQTTSYLATDHYREGTSCQKCHMPEVERPAAKRTLYPTLPDRSSGRHLWPGSSSAEQLAACFELDVAAQGEVVTGSVKNNAGHLVPPTYGRILLVEMAFLSPDSIVREEVTEVSMMKENRLAPGEWTTFRYDRPAGSTRAVFRIRHRRTPLFDPTLVIEQEIELP